MSEVSGPTIETTSTDPGLQPTIPLGLNARAPDFTARSTMGEITSSEYRGHWLLFFSHPANFTPVCTSEFIALEQAKADFDALDCSLLGLSVDSVYSHIAWVRDIRRNFETAITFPIIEDISMAVSKAYGMIHEQSCDTAAVRSVFFIDPHGYIRTLMHYPANVGRSVNELLRVLRALQQSECYQVSTPEGWQPGHDAVLPPPESLQAADERDGAESDVWYVTPTDTQT